MRVFPCAYRGRLSAECVPATPMTPCCDRYWRALKNCGRHRVTVRIRWLKRARPMPGQVSFTSITVAPLLLVTGSCAVNCRYCFRRHCPLRGKSQQPRAMARSIKLYRPRTPSITEVILSGGDPLVATDRFLLELCEGIAGIAHVETLRIHTRLPIVLPARVTAGLRSAIASTRLRLVVVVHCNHPQRDRYRGDKRPGGSAWLGCDIA